MVLIAATLGDSIEIIRYITDRLGENKNNGLVVFSYFFEITIVLNLNQFYLINFTNMPRKKRTMFVKIPLTSSLDLLVVPSIASWNLAT